MFFWAEFWNRPPLEVQCCRPQIFKIGRAFENLKYDVIIIMIICDINDNINDNYSVRDFADNNVFLYQLQGLMAPNSSSPWQLACNVRKRARTSVCDKANQKLTVIQSTRNHTPKWDLMFWQNRFPLEKAPHPNLHILEARHGSLHLGRPTGRPTGNPVWSPKSPNLLRNKGFGTHYRVLRRKPVECQLRRDNMSILSQYTLQHDCESNHLHHFGHYTLSSPEERTQSVSNVCLPGPNFDKCPVASFPGTCQLYITCLLQGLPPPNGASIVPSGPQAPGKQTPQQTVEPGQQTSDLPGQIQKFRRTRHQEAHGGIRPQ